MSQNWTFLRPFLSYNTFRALCGPFPVNYFLLLTVALKVGHLNLFLNFGGFFFPNWRHVSLTQNLGQIGSAFITFIR